MCCYIHKSPVKDECPKSIKVSFGTLHPGDVFTYGDMTCMKCEYVGLEDMFNYVDLADGLCGYLKDFTEVFVDVHDTH